MLCFGLYILLLLLWCLLTDEKKNKGMFMLSIYMIPLFSSLLKTETGVLFSKEDLCTIANLLRMCADTYTPFEHMWYWLVKNSSIALWREMI
jgi:hypothetical protein